MSEIVFLLELGSVCSSKGDERFLNGPVSAAGASQNKNYSIRGAVRNNHALTNQNRNFMLIAKDDQTQASLSTVCYT